MFNPLIVEAQLSAKDKEIARLRRFYLAVKALHDDDGNDEIDRDIGVGDLLDEFDA